MLTREQILGMDDLPTTIVEVPEWGEGEKVIVRGLSSKDRDAFEESMVEVGRKRGSNGKAVADIKVRLRNIRANLVVRCLVDEDGARIFKDADAGQLGEKSGLVMERLWAVARELCGMTEEDAEELAEAFDDAQGEGNSSE